MEQMFRLLFVGLLGGLWLSLEEAICQDLDRGISKPSLCGNISSGKTCFTTFLANGGHPVRRSFKEASDWCKKHVPGSSLIIINSLESLINAENFTGRQELANETIITDAQKLPSKDRTEWSWVNGHPTVPINVSAEQLAGMDGACVVSKDGQSLTYCTGVPNSQYRYICEYSVTDSKSASSYRQNNNSYYVASEVDATWYDAKNECLRLGGDLASITDLQTIDNWPQLEKKQSQKYWIGLHRNKWIWNSTGSALTYTNWEGGFPDDASDNECICINPQCNRTMCQYDRKWRTCNCNDEYAIVCQKTTEEMLPWTIRLTTRTKSSIRSTAPAIATTTSTKTPVVPAAVTPTTTASTPQIKPGTSIETTYTMTITEIDSETASSSSVTQKLSNNSPEHQSTASSTGLFNSFGTKEILLILALFVAVVLIIVAVILIIRKRRYGRRNEGSPTKNTAQSEAVSPVYATVVPDNRPSEGTVPPGNSIYAEVEMIKQPSPPTSNTIYASVQPTSEAVDSSKSLVYADLDFPQKDQQKPSSADKITASLSSDYSQPYKPPTSASTGNTEYAQPIYLEAIDVDPRATQDPSAVYAEPMKLKKSP